jgi:hypothetical protein
MAGREFRCIEDCTIIHPIGQRSIQERIDLPSCRTLTYEGHPISTLQHFHAPQVKQIVLNSYDTKGGRVQQHLDYLCRSDGKMSQLHTLHLMLQCSEKDLVKVLKYMVPLQELVVSVAYPSSSWMSFLESLAAESSNTVWPAIYLWDAHHENENENENGGVIGCWIDWCSSQTWHSNVLPHLRYLGIQSPKGFSQSECLDNCPLLAFVAWTRKHLHPPLEHLKVWEGRGTADDIVVDYISTEFLGKHLGTSTPAYYWGIVSGMATQYLDIHYHGLPLFKQLHSTVLFRQLQTLRFQHLDDETHILPYLRHIKDLTIWGTRIPPYSVDIDLPCVHTLQKLELVGSTCSWMVGRTFHTLRECSIHCWKDFSEDLSAYRGVQVDMPACTKLKWSGNAVASPLFSHPNIQILKLNPLGTSDEVLKLLHNSLSDCPCLQELKFQIWHVSGLDSLIQFVFCDAQEQGVWQDIRSVELKQLPSINGVDQDFNKMVGQTLHYEKWWKELTVSEGQQWGIFCVVLSATM